MHNFNRAVLRHSILCLALLCSFKTGAAVLPDTPANQLPPKGCAAFANTVDIFGSVDVGVQKEQREILKKYLALDSTLVRLGPDVDLDFSDLESDWFPIRFGRCVVLTSVETFVPKDIKIPIREGRVSNALGPVLRYGKHRGANSTFFRVGCPVTTAESDALRMADFVRISGFRLYGPAFEDQGDSDRGIHVDRCVDKVVLNMEIAGWGAAAINVEDTKGFDIAENSDSPGGRIWYPEQVKIANNYVHHNQHSSRGGHALGYGVVVSHGAWADIRESVFDFNRHAIAASGDTGSHAAERNLFLKGGVTTEASSIPTPTLLMPTVPFIQQKSTRRTRLMTTGSRPTESAILHFRFAARTAGAAGRKSVAPPTRPVNSTPRCQLPSMS